MKAVKRAVQLKLLDVPQQRYRDLQRHFDAMRKAVAAVKGSDGH